MDEQRADEGQKPTDPERTPGVPPHQPPMSNHPDEEDVNEEAAEESFPGSDPPVSGGPGV